MKSLQDRITLANKLLAPYAVPHDGTLGRLHEEPEDETRTPFQRDRDRIIHSQAFRRLKGKTQVFVATASDHHRTRLTHTMEAVQISRDIARTLELNEDLAECIALAHDLGHPPFGHAGEEALNAWMEEHRSRFEHNAQSYRIVTELEEHTSLHRGLNLNQEVLDGLLKHHTPHDALPSDLPRYPSLEAQVVNIADEIAYTGHDCDDGLKAGLFVLGDILQTQLAQDAQAQSSNRGTSLRGAIIHLLVMDLYVTTEEQIELQGIRTMDDVYNTQKPIVRFSDDMQKKVSELRQFLWDHMYLHPDVLTKSNEGKEIVRTLCNHFLKNPNNKIAEFQAYASSETFEAVKDYVAGMTDSFAISTFKDVSP